MTRTTALPGLCVALAAAIAYGSNMPFAKMAAELGVSGPDIVFYRALGMALLLGGATLASAGTLRVAAASRGALLGLGLSTAVVALGYISSVAFVPVGVATIVYYTYPLLILATGPIFEREPVTPLRAGIFLLAFAGLALAIGPAFGALDLRGVLLAGCAAFGALAQFRFAAHVTRDVSPLAAGFWTQLVVAPVALLVCTATGGPMAPAGLLAAAVPVGLTCGLFLIGFVLQLFAARMAPPAAVGLVFCAEPVTSTALAGLVLGERLSPAQVSGGLLVLIAIVAAIALESRRARPA